MKKLFSLFAATLLAISTLFAQVPAIQWQNTIGGEGASAFRALQQTIDSGYILGGWSNANILGDKTENSNGGFDFWVVKLDVTGTIQWQNTIGGNDDEVLNSLQQTTDGGYILGGHSKSNISGDKTENSWGKSDYWVVKLDAGGSVQWQNTIGGNNSDELYSIQQTVDGGYILGGASRSNISGDKTENSNGYFDYWVVKLNATGAIQWQNTIGGNSGDGLYSIQQTVEGGYILGGSSSSNISGDKTEEGRGYWVVKLDLMGTIQWQNTISCDSGAVLYSLQQTADGGYVLGGYSNSNISGDKTENSNGGYDYWVVKLDDTGDVQWQNTIGGENDDFLNSIQQTADGGYILSGFSNSNISGDKTENSWGVDDYWVVKLDTAGKIQWQRTIGGSSYDFFCFLKQTFDGGYILGGQSLSDISGDKTENRIGSSDYWVVKLGPLVPTVEASPASPSITIYPNPASDAVFVRTDNEVTLNLYNAMGQSLLTQTYYGNGKIDLSSLPTGIYFLVEMETGIGHKILKR